MHNPHYSCYNISYSPLLSVCLHHRHLLIHPFSIFSSCLFSSLFPVAELESTKHQLEKQRQNLLGKLSDPFTGSREQLQQTADEHYRQLEKETTAMEDVSNSYNTSRRDVLDLLTCPRVWSNTFRLLVN